MGLAVARLPDAGIGITLAPSLQLLASRPPPASALRPPAAVFQRREKIPGGSPGPARDGKTLSTRRGRRRDGFLASVPRWHRVAAMLSERGKCCATFLSESSSANEERKKVIKKSQSWVRFSANDRPVTARDHH